MRTFGVCAATAATVAVCAGVSLGSDVTPSSAKLAAAVRPRVVCGASFRHLPPHWHQSGPPRALIIGGYVPSNTDSWAATPPSVWNLVKPLPRDGIYIWVLLSRPRHGPTGTPLRLPLTLRKGLKIGQEGSPRLPEYRIEGRYRRQYDVILGVDFGRASPPRRLRRLANRVLRGIALPRWVPFPQRSSC